MIGFAAAWNAVCADRNGERVSSELRPFLASVYEAVLASPPNLKALKSSLETLLAYLSSAGRTNANCWAADLFFCNSEGWERDWTDQELPDEYQEVLARMGEALHDTVTSPDTAENFQCLPEQLLKQVQQLP